MGRVQVWTPPLVRRRMVSSAAPSSSLLQWRLLVLTLVALVACTVPVAVDALVYDEYLYTSDDLTEVLSFGFDADGTLTYTIEYEPAYADGVHFMLCTDDELSKFNKQYVGDGVCNAGVRDADVCHTLVFVESSGQTAVIDIRERNHYTVLVSNCYDEVDTFRLRMTLLNAGGEHLSYDERQLSSMYAAFAAVWLLALGAYVYNWMMLPGLGNDLHRYMGVVLVFKLLTLCYAAAYWSRLSASGVVSTVAEHALLSSDMAFDLLLCALVLLTAKGWCVTRGALYVGELFAIFATSLCFVGCWHFIAVDSNGIYIFGFVMIYVIFVKQALNAITANVQALREQLVAMVGAGEDTALLYVSPVYLKLKFFKAVQVMLTSYYLLDPMALLAVLFLLVETRWLRDTLIEIMNVYMLAGLAYNLALRRRPQLPVRTTERDLRRRRSSAGSRASSSGGGGGRRGSGDGAFDMGDGDGDAVEMVVVDSTLLGLNADGYWRNEVPTELRKYIHRHKGQLYTILQTPREPLANGGGDALDGDEIGPHNVSLSVGLIDDLQPAPAEEFRAAEIEHENPHMTSRERQALLWRRQRASFRL